jgi:hypothetical protein
MLDDVYNNDLAYIDYITNFILTIKQSSSHASLLSFSSLDLITDKGFRQKLIEVARELHN